MENSHGSIRVEKDGRKIMREHFKSIIILTVWWEFRENFGPQTGVKGAYVLGGK